MIPSKLYIPTSTLNFNSIMSSESISPAGFYSVRGFGYKRFEKVAPNNLNNRIILYDKYPEFNVNDKELENYPLVIEIDIITIKDDIIKEHKDGIYFSEETIYFNPFTTKFFFREEREKYSTLSKSEPSIEAKMVPAYKNCFFVRNMDIESFEWKTIEVVDVASNFDIHISKDRKINKLKGFLYVFLLGANKSLSSEVVYLKKYAKELKNVLSAVISSSDGQETNNQELQLKELNKSINNAFHKAEGLDKKLDSIIKLKTEQYKCSSFVDMLKSEGLFEIWCSKQNLRPSFQVKQFYIPRNSSFDDRQKLFDDYFAELERNIDKFVTTRNIGVEELPIIRHGSKIESISTQKEFLVKLINEYLSEAYNRTEFLQSRYDFAFSGGKLFREELHEKWDGSEHQVYINSLLKNLKEYTPFVLNSTSNPTLKSFGAFCQKGDEDIDKLEDYLISNGIGDFRIAFALWGIVFGFANMPKTLTNELFTSNDIAYKSIIYNYIFKQVHGIELEGKFESKEEQEIIVISSQLNGNISKDRPEAVVIDNNIHIEDSSLELENKLLSCKLKPEQTESIKDVYRQYGNQVSKLFFDSIKKKKGIGDKKVQQIKEALGYVEQQSTKQTTISNSSSLLEQIPVGKDFYKDENTFSYIEMFLQSDKKIRKQFKEDLDWFQDEYNKGELSQYYSKASRDNSSVIEAYNRYLTKKKYASKMNIIQIISKLKELYNK